MLALPFMVQPRARLLPLLAAVSLLPTLAGAEKLVPLAPDMKPAPVKELRDRFHEAIARGAVGTDVELVPTNEVRKLLSGLPALADCVGGACIGNVATTMHAGQVLVTHIDQTGRRYVVQAVVFDATGKEIGKGEERCDICTVREADETVTKAVRKAVASIVVTPPTPPVAVKTTTPPEEPIGGPDGPRENGKEPTTPTSSPTAKTTVTIDTAPAKPKDSDGPSKVPFRPLAIAGFGLAGASLIGAISFFAFVPRDGKTTCGPGVPSANCPTIYSGNGIGAGVFTGLTLVAAAAGGVLLYFDLKTRKKTPVVTILPTSDGVAGSASFEF
jgi:hypothetical protein